MTQLYSSLPVTGSERVFQIFCVCLSEVVAADGGGRGGLEGGSLGRRTRERVGREVNRGEALGGVRLPLFD